MTEKMDLTDKEWRFLLSGEMPEPDAPLTDSIRLPSTVQQAGKSPVTDERSDGFLTDPRRFEGYALYERTVELTPAAAGRDLFLVLERTRTSRLWIDGSYAGTQNSLCTPHRYRITEYFKNAPLRILLMVDNVSCPVPGGHMTSQDTQTNWLGVTGAVYIEYRNFLRFENVRIFPDPAAESVTVTGVVTGGEKIRLSAEVEGFPKKTVTLTKETPSFVYEMKGAERWSEHNPVSYIMTLSSDGDVTRIPFGMRRFQVCGRDFLLNGEKIFLRGRHDGMLFPLTGAAPTDTDSWLKVMKTAREYGINHFRFHTCCPPEAAFLAADQTGIYLEPELPFWGTVEEEITPAQQYLIDEGFRILDSFANHPSFFALSLGNELWGSKERLNAILGGYKSYDPRPLYTQGSNNFQFSPCTVENDDFFVGVRFSRDRLFRGSYAMCDAPQGHIQTAPPNSDYSYDANIRPASVSGERKAGGTTLIQYGTGVKAVSVDAGEEFIAEMPVVSHEIGQYFMYPDYSEIPRYTGVLKPYNLEIFRDRLREAGLLSLADRYFLSSGRFAADCYKSEIETALRSKELSGFQLLDLQDFTGQGTALVGILNSLLDNKGIITAEKWRSFCNDRVILGCLPGFVHSARDTVRVGVKLYHYGKTADTDPSVTLRLSGEDGLLWQAEVSRKGVFRGGVFDIGCADLKIPEIQRPMKAVLSLACADLENEYTLWLYPSFEGGLPSGLTVTHSWREAKTALSQGKNVLFFPKDLSDAVSLEGTYCTDFWNYPMFRSISESMNRPLPVGTLGLLIDNRHPALAGFPSETYSTPQWYTIVSRSRALILDGVPLEPIVRTIDNCARNHSLATVFETVTGGGRLLVCTADLEDGSSPACRCLYRSLADYAASEAFAPRQAVSVEILDRLFS